MKTRILVSIWWFLAVGLGAQGADVFPAKVEVERIPGVKPRNLVFILTDDHRYDAMGFMGHPFLETPNLDRLARGGAHLKNAFVTTSLCSPSRASVLTGLYTHKHRVIDNARLEPEGIVYFPQYLQAAGYATAFIGKWHMGQESDAPRPGFDHWVSFKGQGNYLPVANSPLNVDGKAVPQKGYITDELTDYAVTWLRQQKPAEKPFFLYLSHKAVHANFTPAERHEGKYKDAKWTRPGSENLSPEWAARVPRWVRDQRNSWHGVDFPYHSDLDIEQYYKRYCETFLAVDESIGRIQGELQRMGVAEDTLVIYMGDNGFMFGEHGLIDKRVAYDTSIRVPMVMQCPSLFPGGQTVEAVTANIDVGPTFLDAAGIRRPPHMDGQSMLPLARGDQSGRRKDFLYVYYWEKSFPQTPTQFALRGDRYKLISYYGLWDTDELYDLQEDPGETRNLISDPGLQKVRKEMEQKLFGMLEEAGGMQIPLNPPPPGQGNKRLGPRGGHQAADFPPDLVLEAPPNRNAM